MAAEKRRRRERVEESGKTEDHHPHLPLEVIMENIVSRVPVRSLIRCSCVCKLWYKTIYKDPHFASAYLENSKKDAFLLFYLFNIGDYDLPPESQMLNCFFSLKYLNGTNMEHRFNCIFPLESRRQLQMIGSCNGLVCISEEGCIKSNGSILIVNLCRRHLLFINRPIIDGYMIICQGLGFDSLTHEYKIVLIARSTGRNEAAPADNTVKGNNNNNELLLFKCLVFTLGKNSWRETTTSTTIPSLLGVGKTTSFYKSSLFCGGALFWRTRSSLDKQAAAANMLLSFDLHDDKFQVIPLPAECASSMLEQHQIVDPLLEFKGYPCVARLEKTILRGGSSGGGGTTSKDKVHLHILKDKVLHLWIKETFDIAHVSPSFLASPTVSCFFRSTDRLLPTRIVSVADLVYIYCFDGQNMQSYNLQTKCVYHATGDHRDYDIFHKKELSPPPPNFDDDDSNLCKMMDYHLSGCMRNFLSLQDFVPKGARKLDLDSIRCIWKDPQSTYVGYFCDIGGESDDYYLF